MKKLAIALALCGALIGAPVQAKTFVGVLWPMFGALPAIDTDKRERIVADLVPHDALVMRNHGLLTCGATIQQAFNTMYQLEMSCRSQVDAMTARTELTMPGGNVLAHTAHLYQPGGLRRLGMAGDAAASRGAGENIRLSAVLALGVALTALAGARCKTAQKADYSVPTAYLPCAIENHEGVVSRCGS